MKSRKPYRNGKVHQCRQMCKTCIFRPGNLCDLQLGRVEQMVQQATARGSAIICHSTLDGDQAVCAGFAKYHGTVPLRLAAAMGILELVDV